MAVSQWRISRFHCSKCKGTYAIHLMEHIEDKERVNDRIFEAFQLEGDKIQDILHLVPFSSLHP
ncbi:hypothetical protein FRX31_027549 [Thalictrum thalictroides]|uniref:Uncharacterized protein n=1 Tax=Thalictrum thalictroides TaxID=46969 RepID=A0A7J6VDP3_THATH|nr:hypothetical protein FRX31_027549 [Thalictrum thalictroides]